VSEAQAGAYASGNDGQGSLASAFQTAACCEMMVYMSMSGYKFPFL